MKKLIKKLIPIDLRYKHLLRTYAANGKKTDEEIKKQISVEYYKIFNRELDWKNPKTYTEKLNVAKLFEANKLKTKLTDKYEVRKWVEEKIGAEFLIPLIGVYDSFNEIAFDKLPETFVIKCNHDSGSTMICNKRDMNVKEMQKKYNYYIKRDFSLVGYEKHYHDIKPKILIEKNMGDSINDYKFICLHGKPYYCRVDFDRFGNHKRNVYDLNWKLQPFNQGYYDNILDVTMPPNFNKMIEIATILSKDIDQVRVDLYDINGKIYFGEMTFTSGAGLEPFVPDQYDYQLGELWK